MMKQIFTLAALAALSLPVSADTLDLSLTDLGCGWNSSYDAATKTITYDTDWSGKGWWLQDSDLADLSNWDKVTVEFEPCACQIQLVVQYQEGENNNTTAMVAEGSTSVSVDLDAAYKAKAMQIYVQSAKAGTLTLTKAYLENGVVVDQNLLWEGEYKISGWNSGAEFAASKVKAGDLLEYTFSEAGSDGGQVLLKNSSWANLMGSSKITPKDMAAGKVQVGVTQEMIDDCGGKIFLQGDGGAVCTKVEKVGSFNSDGVLSMGARVLSNSAFITIPDGAKKIAVDFSAKPEWVQLCNTSWVDYEMEYVESEDGLTRTYTLTDNVISTVNDKKELVLNGPDAVAALKIYIPSEVGVNAVQESAIAGKTYNIQGIEVKDTSTPGIYIRDGKKFVVK